MPCGYNLSDCTSELVFILCMGFLRLACSNLFDRGLCVSNIQHSARLELSLTSISPRLPSLFLCCRFGEVFKRQPPKCAFAREALMQESRAPLLVEKWGLLSGYWRYFTRRSRDWMVTGRRSRESSSGVRGGEGVYCLLCQSRSGPRTISGLYRVRPASF